MSARPNLREVGTLQLGEVWHRRLSEAPLPHDGPAASRAYVASDCVTQRHEIERLCEARIDPGGEKVIPLRPIRRDGDHRHVSVPLDDGSPHFAYQPSLEITDQHVRAGRV